MFNFLWLFGNINAVNSRLSAINRSKRLKHLKRRRFAGAIRPENTENLALTHAKRHAVYHVCAAIRFH